jgi:hypothetical protein
MTWVIAGGARDYRKRLLHPLGRGRSLVLVLAV